MLNKWDRAWLQDILKHPDTHSDVLETYLKEVCEPALAKMYRNHLNREANSYTITIMVSLEEIYTHSMNAGLRRCLVGRFGDALSRMLKELEKEGFNVE